MNETQRAKEHFLLDLNKTRLAIMRREQCTGRFCPERMDEM